MAQPLSPPDKASKGAWTTTVALSGSLSWAISCDAINEERIGPSSLHAGLVADRAPVFVYEIFGTLWDPV